jgi:hypothetical protein
MTISGDEDISVERLEPIRHPWRDEEELDAVPAATLRTSIILWDLGKRNPFRL